MHCVKIVDNFWSWIFVDYKRDDVNILGNSVQLKVCFDQNYEHGFAIGPVHYQNCNYVD